MSVTDIYTQLKELVMHLQVFWAGNVSGSMDWVYDIYFD